MCKGDAGDEEERACVGGVANVGVEAFGDEPVVRVDGEVKGEEFAEGAEAVESDVGSEEDREGTDEEERGCVDGGGGGGGGTDEECECGRGRRCKECGCVEERFESGAYPEDGHMDFEDERRDSEDPPLFGVVSMVWDAWVWRSASEVVGYGLDGAEDGSRERHD